MSEGVPMEAGQFTGHFPWIAAHPCFNGHKLVDDETPMVCDRCGAWLVYHPNGSWRSPLSEADDV